MPPPHILLAAPLLALGACAAVAPRADDADRMPVPLTAAAGDAARGHALAISREGAHCILCHALPEEKFAGDIGPPLQGVGTRLNVAQLRRRVVDITVIRPDTTMPAFHRVNGLQRVAPEYRGKPVLSAQDVEDVIAYLSTLRE
ncbi:MAG: sulfur oxidation c-type cytochrome SoxX [Betaproteobacteria bacterium]|nr:sulfur oxidation c-type cytochrome SoxX [Betaproteobacteria bacterium]